MVVVPVFEKNKNTTRFQRGRARPQVVV